MADMGRLPPNAAAHDEGGAPAPERHGADQDIAPSPAFIGLEAASLLIISDETNETFEDGPGAEKLLARGGDDVLIGGADANVLDGGPSGHLAGDRGAATRIQASDARSERGPLRTLSGAIGRSPRPTRESDRKGGPYGQVSSNDA